MVRSRPGKVEAHLSTFSLDSSRGTRVRLGTLAEDEARGSGGDRSASPHKLKIISKSASRTTLAEWTKKTV